ncbi:hypothetical protein ACYOEI_41755, partial [Singulisphaera rosea]
MCLGIALIGSELPTDLIGRSQLGRHYAERGRRPEYRFYWNDRRPRLPVWRDGRLMFVRWGNGPGQ